MAEKTLDAVRVLEAEFAEAMSRMYAVGNGLAALRQRLLLEQGQGPVAVAAPQGQRRPRLVRSFRRRSHRPRQGILRLART